MLPQPGPDRVALLTLTFEEIGPADFPQVGGKAANLGALTRAGVRVPPGFCVTSRAFELFVAQLHDADRHFDRLAQLDGKDVDGARSAAESMRQALDRLPMPDAAADAIIAAWRILGPDRALAVRSSATAEDLPGASFAGQQDTYLNIRGDTALLDAVRRCWISLFTDRAVLYRARGGYGHRQVRLAVVVQQLVEPDVSGILFTADPVSGHRRRVSIDAGFGLGEALVSGLISADLYQIDRDRREILVAAPGNKAFAIRSAPGGGTYRETLSESQRGARALTDAQVLALADVGDRIEHYYGGAPQDIEWLITDDVIYIVQARPITSLFPIPQSVTGDAGPRIFLSFGHIQMMLDAMPTLALEIWQLIMPFGKGGAATLRDAPRHSPAMVTAGSRLFLDATSALRTSLGRHGLLRVISIVYADLGRAAATLADRPEWRDRGGRALHLFSEAVAAFGPIGKRVPALLLLRDPVRGAQAFDRAIDDLTNDAATRIQNAAAPGARIRQCAVEINAMFGSLRVHAAQMAAGFIAFALIKRAARGKWADIVRDDVDLIMRGVPGNVTTNMDLAVGDLTDLARAHEGLLGILDGRAWSQVRAQLPGVRGGPEFLAALDQFLVRYGDRGAGEIDASRPRWRDDPSLLLRVVAGGASSGEPGQHRRRHAEQTAIGDAAAQRLVQAGRNGLLGGLRSRWIARLCHVARRGLGLREHPKFLIVRLLGLVRAETLAAGAVLARRGQLADASDVWHLQFEEIARALDDPAFDARAIAEPRIEMFRRDLSRRPPLAMSSLGETPSLALERADLPDGAMAGTAASAGVIEGIARVVTDPQREMLLAGEILVAPFTDPGWTPLFVHAAGVVTEVGGLMTHGAVVAREYGIPAVVSVAAAVERIKTGQRIRVDGTRGFVQILNDT